MSKLHLNELYKKYNNTQKLIESSKKLHEFLLDNVKKHPDKIAVRNKKESITYEQLYNKMIEVTNLFDFNNQPIAIMGYKNIDVVGQILGVLNSGNFFIPINPASPDERINYILDKTQAKAFIDCKNTYFLHDKVNVVNTIKPLVGDDSLAYVIFTSGTTGMPKGVIESHYQVVNTIFDLIERFDLDDTDYFLNLSSLSFDLSIFDIFASIIVGGTLHLVEDPRDFNEINMILSKYSVTIWNSVPNLMYLYLNSNKVIENKLKHCLLSGDFISVGLAKLFYKELPNVNLHSLGGATEGTIWSITYNVMKNEVNQLKYIPYGYPLTNQTIYILNNEHDFCDVGEVGEIAIGGMGVAHGYINDQFKTSKSFIHHPRLGYIYLTGDLGIYTEHNYIKILGRKNDDFKVNGYRLSLSEISNKFNKCFNTESRILLTKDTPKKMIIAYEGEISSDKNEILKKLSNYLLPYEMPNYVFKVERFPITINGKTDYNKLFDIYMEQRHFIRKNKDSTDDVSTELRKMLSLELDVTNIQSTDTLLDFGVDSIQMMRIKIWIENKIGRELEMIELYENNSVKELETLLTER